MAIDALPSHTVVMIIMAPFGDGWFMSAPQGRQLSTEYDLASHGLVFVNHPAR
jgi:hypothetical protein